MQPPCAEVGKCVHPEFKSCAHRLSNTLNTRENGAHAGCTASEIMHPALKSCTHGAPLISNTAASEGGFFFSISIYLITQFIQI